MRKLMPRLAIPWFLIFSSLLCASFAYAQEQASIAGKVADSKGIPVPGASVSVSSGLSRLAETLTDLDGSFKFEELPAGVYQLAIEIVGFLKASKDAVDTSADSSQNMAIQLESLPRPPRPKVLSQAAKKQETQTLDAPSFQTAEVTDLPGLNQFRQDSAQETGDAGSLASRQENLLFISGNSANLDAGNFSDPGFRNQIMDAARLMGFQVREFDQGNEGGRGAGAGGLGGQGGGGGAWWSGRRHGLCRHGRQRRTRS
jgi:hypothetical protein